MYKLHNYYKVIIVRNPMERLVSAYRNKLEAPLNFTIRKQFPERLKAYILRTYNKKILNAWIDYGNYSIDLHPSFSDFLKFMMKFPLNIYNEHFKPLLELCYPCAVHYDFYLNFKSMEYDVYALMHYLGIPYEYYPSYVSHPEKPTARLLEHYFGSVALAEKVKLFRVFSKELEFYYSLYPEEWGMHKDL